MRTEIKLPPANYKTYFIKVNVIEYKDNIAHCYEEEMELFPMDFPQWSEAHNKQFIILGK